MKHDMLNGYADREREPDPVLGTHTQFVNTWLAPATAMVVVSIWFAFFL